MKLYSPKYTSIFLTKATYPVKLGDSYGLQSNCSGYKDWETKVCHPADLETIHDVSQSYYTGSGQLGETWLVWGKLNQPDAEVDEGKTAQDLLQSLDYTVTADWHEHQRPYLWNQEAVLFEWSPPNQSETKPHLLICLFKSTVDDQTVLNRVSTSLYPQLMHLCYSRHKVLWLYGNTRTIKQELKNCAVKVQNLVQAVHGQGESSQEFAPNQSSSGLTPNQLSDHLKEALSLYARYSEWLSYLEECRYALEVNGDNYHKRLRRWLALEKPGDGAFWLDFYDEISEQFIPQVVNDHNTLAAGLNLLENLLKTTEGLINLEQTRVDAQQGERDRAIEARDRNIEALVGSAGVGIGAASAAAGAWAGETARPLHTFGLSLGIGVLCGVVVYGVVRLIRR